jgi:carbonic anhydrase
MSHKCKSIIIHCMDFRLVEATRDWMTEKGILGDCDAVSLAGASKELIDGDDSVCELVLKQIKIAHELHGVNEVILLHHSDCGAYKAAYQFANPEEEKEKQLADLGKSEQTIKVKFPDIKVTKVWAQMMDSDGRQVDFQIL